jgi:phosphate transport system permease protein
MYLKRRIRNLFVEKWMMFTLAIILLFPIIISFALLLKAYPIFSLDTIINLLFSSNWAPTKGNFGFLPFISSSLYVTIIAFLLSAPICLLAGIYLTQFSSKRLIHIMHPIIDILAGIPSVVYGVWGVLVIVPFVGKNLAPIFNTTSTGYSILAGGIVLAVMCIPYMLNMIIESFQTVPIQLKEASLALGSTKWECIKKVVIKKAMPGIISAFGLGIAKAFGETLAVMMVVGNMVKISANPFDAGYPLPALIANNYGEMLSIPMYDSALMFAALLLLIVILFINLFFRYFIYKTQK